MRWHVSACALFLACADNVDPADSAQPNASTGQPTSSAMPSNTGVSGRAPSDEATVGAERGGAGMAVHAAAGGAGAGTTMIGMTSMTGMTGVTTSAGAGAGAGGAAPAQPASAGAASGVAGGAGAMAASTAGASAGAGGMNSGASGMGAGADAPVVQGCEGSTLLALPDDTSVRGPWPIGSKTLKFGRFSGVELFYPAEPGSEQGKSPIEYDMRAFLPAQEQQKIPDAEATIVTAGTFRDLPIDASHGPYPVMIFVHGTASFRLRSLSSETLWASRGFVVMAADHPNLYLADYLGSNGCGLSVPPLDLSGDVDSEIAALSDPKDDLAFLAGHIDMQRLVLAGHSAGAYNVAQFTSKPGVQMVIALAGTRAVAASSTLKSVLFVAGLEDAVLPYGPGGVGLGSILYPGSDTDAYNRSPGPSAVRKRLVGIADAGHLNVVDGCAKNAMNKTGIEVAMDHGVCGAGNVAPLADCGSIEAMQAISITNEIMTAAMEETLQCQDRAEWIRALPSRHPEVADFQEDVD